MSAGPRQSSRPAGPGRGKPRKRTGPANKSGSPALAGESASPDITSPEAGEAEPQIGRQRRRPSLTTRALALAVVLLVLAISYANSLRVYLSQRADLAATRAEIVQRQQHITQLSQQLQRWQDPAYVRAQAREQLGWVVPGEVGYRVVGADGKPLPSAPQISGSADDQKAKAPTAWWSRLAGSLRAADKPERAPGDSQPRVITPSTDPVTPAASPGR